MRNYCLKADLTISWGWGNMHEAHFAAGTPCKASNQPKNKFWIDGEPTSFTGDSLDFSSWMETYGFLVDRDEVEPCTESNTNYNDLNDILSNASTYEEEAEDFLNGRNIPYNTHSATALIRMAWNHGWRPETKNLNEASFHKDEFSNQIEVDGFEYQGRIFNCVVECDYETGEEEWEGDPSVHGGMHRMGKSIEDMEHKLVELYEVIGDDVIEIQQTDPIFKEVEAALDEELWNNADKLHESSQLEEDAITGDEITVERLMDLVQNDSDDTGSPIHVSLIDTVMRLREEGRSVSDAVVGGAFMNLLA